MREGGEGRRKGKEEREGGEGRRRGEEEREGEERGRKKGGCKGKC